MRPHCPKRFVLGTVLASVLWCQATAPAASLSPLLENSRHNLVLARMRGVEILSLAIVSQPGQNEATAASVEALGGKVHYRFAPADFISAALKRDRLAELLANAPLASVTVDSYGLDYLRNQHVYSDFPISRHVHADLPDSTPTVESRFAGEPAFPDLTGWPPTPGARPLDEPYDVLADMDGRELRREQPTYDGRGVVIAHVEVNFADFLLPELQFGTTLSGERVPKFVDVINFPSLGPSLEEDARPWSGGWTGWQWGRLGAPVRRDGDHLRFEGVRYRVPRSDQAFRIGVIEMQTRYLAAIGLVENGREGDATPERTQKTAMPMLWSDSRHMLWLDVDRDDDFTDETGVEPFARTQAFGVLGKDDPDTDVRETIAYAVQKDGSNVSLNFGISGHGALVAGAAAAHRGDNGRLEGIAPGARFIAIGTGDTTSSYAQALIRAFTDPRTDVVLVEGFTHISGMDDALRQGQSTLALLIGRLSERYRKPCFITSDNTHGMSTIVDMSVPTGVMAVSAYQSARGTLINSGIRLPQPDNLHGVGGEGPAGNGALKPDLLAPANPISLEAGFRPAERGNQRYEGLFQLPPGYGVGGGTSTAAPVAAGAAAVLVSAAKQNDLPQDAISIQDALRSSARLLENIPPYKQGNGLVQIGAAWRLLQERVGHDPLEIVIEAPVKTVHSDLLPIPHRGPGWFEREGWRVGEARTRKVMVTRRTGPVAPMTFQVRWRGDRHEVFESAPQITLPLGRAVPLEVTAHARTAGAHSAILELHHAEYAGAVHRMAVTLVAPHELNAENDYRFEAEADIRPLDRQSYYVRVPAGADALTVAFEHDNPGVRIKVSPPGRTLRGHFIDPVRGRRVLSFAAPRPGVWEIVVFHTGLDAFDWSTAHEVARPTRVRLRADVTRVSVTQVAPDRFVLENDFAAFTGGAVSGSLGSLRKHSGSVHPGQPQIHDLDIPAGTELLVAEIETEAPSLIGLSLYDCTRDNICYGSRKALGRRSTKHVAVENPAAGHWKVVVDALAISQEKPLSYEYREYFLHPRFGSLGVTDALIPRMPGEKWAVQTRTWRAEGVPAGRTPIALFSVQDPERHQLHFRSHLPDIEGAILPYAFDNMESVSVPMGTQIIELE